MKIIYAILFSAIMMLSPVVRASEKVSRVILFTIEGLHWNAPRVLNMPAMNSLIKEGVYIQKSDVIIPHRPTVGDYSKFNSCSFSNPVLHQGTIFIRPENKMIQEMVPRSAFIVNSDAYSSVGRGFTTSIMDTSLTDGQVVEKAEFILKYNAPVFMRIHLETPGIMGELVAFRSAPDMPFFRDIFGEGSPYVKAIQEADRLLGQFISFLKAEGKWEGTVLIVTSDHGQSQAGWHPFLDEDSWVTPLVFAGQGIAKGRELPCFGHTDLAPTIAWLLGIEPPNKNGGAGTVVKEIVGETEPRELNQPEMSIKTLNHQIKEFNILKSEIILRAEQDRYLSNFIATMENQELTPEPFYHQDRITEWYKAGSTSHLIEANEKILEIMRKVLFIL